MFYISKAQYQQLVQNTQTGSLYSVGNGCKPLPRSEWVIPYGFELDSQYYLLCLADDRPGKVLHRYTIFDDEGEDHTILEWVPYRLFRFKFMLDLALAYRYWGYCRWQTD